MRLLCTLFALMMLAFPAPALGADRTPCAPPCKPLVDLPPLNAPDAAAIDETAAPGASYERDLPPLNAPPVQASASPPASAQESALSADYFHLQTGGVIRWNDQTPYLTVYIHDGAHLPGWNPENPARVKAAFAQWEVAMAPRFRFVFMPDARDADVQVFWAPRLDAASVGAEMAGTNEYALWGKYLAKNDIRLTLLTLSGEAMPPSLIQSAALHEIGHMLGIKAHSDYAGDVMAAMASADALDEPAQLSARDIATMRRVYAAKPHYANPPGVRLANFDAFKKTQKGRRFTLLWVPIPGLPVPVPIPLPF